jgi:hypothetical protein
LPLARTLAITNETKTLAARIILPAENLILAQRMAA